MLVLATLFGKKLSSSDFSFSQVTSVEKREPRKHFSASACSFLGLGLRPRPQKSGFGFEKLFLGSLFSTSVTWEKLKSDVDKFFLRVASTIIRTKYYFLFNGWLHCIVESLRLPFTFSRTHIRG